MVRQELWIYASSQLEGHQYPIIHLAIICHNLFDYLLVYNVSLPLECGQHEDMGNPVLESRYWVKECQNGHSYPTLFIKNIVEG
jgi:hypothetical protein